MKRTLAIVFMGISAVCLFITAAWIVACFIIWSIPVNEIGITIRIALFGTALLIYPYFYQRKYRNLFQ